MFNMVIITYNRKEVGNMKYDDAPAEGGDSGDKPAEGGGDSGDSGDSGNSGDSGKTE